MKLLEVENLVTELGEGENWLRAVDNISLAVEPGQTYCLVGESGSGKSVTALSIMGLLPHGHYRHPDGHIQLTDPQGQLPDIALLNADDETLRSVRGSRVAMIFQEPMTSLNPVQTIGEQLEEVLLIHRPELDEEARKQKILAALAEVRIPDPKVGFGSIPIVYPVANASG